jgi:hypothetical protein
MKLKRGSSDDEFIKKMLDTEECVFCAKEAGKFKIEFGPLLNKVAFRCF